MADNQNNSLANKIKISCAQDQILLLEPQKWPYEERFDQPVVNRITVAFDQRLADGAWYRREWIQGTGITGPKHVSDMLDSGNLADAEPYIARLRPAMANTRLFKFWIDYCQREHGEHCEQSRLTPEHISSMHSIRLIDVQRDCIVTLDLTEHVRWVALSYVWGEAQKHTLTKNNYTSYHLPGALKPNNMPLAILDAMTVTRDLGELYLWAESLCIIQDDEEDKRQYVPAMGIIYGGANVTIIKPGKTQQKAEEQLAKQAAKQLQNDFKSTKTSNKKTSKSSIAQNNVVVDPPAYEVVGEVPSTSNRSGSQIRLHRGFETPK
ncbi:heterokaryon incompatibility protein-domain-containing protein [Aspergillus cavernicola]|uniref:Heterokaryon incompatibility protein-domain-containing protein n=1 Tax=Aspergillus cavernicola TaxID=176166 RepID=A0ABR4IXT8_9EURO